MFEYSEILVNLILRFIQKNAPIIGFSVFFYFCFYSCKFNDIGRTLVEIFLVMMA